MIPKSLEEVLPHMTNPVSPIQSNSDAVPTPVNARAFSYLLEGYKDREYIVRFFTEGFLTHFEGVDEELNSSNSKCSPLSIREKSTPGQYRLLHNLLYPYDDKSVDHNISDKNSSVKYSTLHARCS